MAITGLSNLYVAKYAFAEGAVTYTEALKVGKAREANITINSATDNDLYGDNEIAETDRRFQSGTITLSTTDLSQEASAMILGITPVALESIPGVTDENVMELNYDDDLSQPYLGVGFVIRKRVNGKDLWRPVVLTRVMFQVPEDAAVTEEGGNISWQVPTITGTILRDETEKHRWKRESLLSTEAQAVAYVKYRLGAAA